MIACPILFVVSFIAVLISYTLVIINCTCYSLEIKKYNNNPEEVLKTFKSNLQNQKRSFKDF